jgi:hypothetical protein
LIDHNHNYWQMANYRQFILLIMFFIGQFNQVLAQSADSLKTPLVLSGRVHYGFIIPHSPEIEAISNSTPIGGELELAWHLNSAQTWRTFGCYPRIGIAASYINFGNPAELGNAYSIQTFFEPYLAIQKRLNFSFRMGMGISYLNQVYDAETNPRNLFYSSPISFLVHAGFSSNYRLNSQWNLRLQAWYSHISNGGMKNPNKGINFPTVSLGLEYMLRKGVFLARNKDDWRDLYPHRTYTQLMLLGTVKPLDKEKPQKYPIVGLNAQVNRVIGRLSSLSLGSEWLVNDVVSRLAEGGQGSPHQVGMLFGHELRLGKLFFTQQIGAYIYRDYKSDDWLYQRYGIYLRTGKKHFVGANLKAHRNVADFVDFRIGLVW